MTTQEFRNQIFSLAERLYPMVRRMLKTEEESKDAIQDVMLKLWKKRNQLQDHPHPSAFVFLTARNHCLDVLRKRKLPLVDSPAESQMRSYSGHEDFKLRELVALIENLLQDSPKKHRDILLMRDLDGMEYQEIALITGLKVEYVRVIVSRTRMFVQQHLKKNYNYE